MIPAAPSDVTSLFSQSQLGIDTRCPDPIIKRSEAVFCGMPLSACNSLIEQPTQNDEKKWLLMAASWEKLAANVSRDEEVIKASLGLLATIEGHSSLQMPEASGSSMMSRATMNEPEVPSQKRINDSLLLLRRRTVYDHRHMMITGPGD